MLNESREAPRCTGSLDLRDSTVWEALESVHIWHDRAAFQRRVILIQINPPDSGSVSMEC